MKTVLGHESITPAPFEINSEIKFKVLEVTKECQAKKPQFK